MLSIPIITQDKVLDNGRKLLDFNIKDETFYHID